MQEINIFFFDQLCNEEVFKRFFPNVTIKSIKYAFTYGILRYHKPSTYHLFETSKRYIIFGRVFRVIISEDDLELLQIHRPDSKFKEIDVSILEDVEDLYTGKYKIMGMARASTFISTQVSLRFNRHNSVGNFTKYLLI